MKSCQSDHHQEQEEQCPTAIMPMLRNLAVLKTMSCDEEIWSESALPRRHQRRRRRSRSDPIRALAFCAAVVLFVLMPNAVAFTMVMKDYKPPVQSSVSKLRNTRFTSSATASSTSLPQSSSSTKRRRKTETGSPRSSTSKRAVSSAASWSQEAPSSGGGDSFSQRMRKLVLGQQELQKKSNEIARRFSRSARAASAAAVALPSPPESIATEELPHQRQRQQPFRPSNVLTVSTLRDFSQVVSGGKQIVAVRFYAPWCRACHAMAPRFYQMAKEHPGVVFVDVPVTDDNANLHAGLGVPSLPYGHVYHPDGGLVTEMPLTRPRLNEFKQQLASFVTGSCDLGPTDDASNPHQQDR